jgi:hypothetical protein
LARRSIAVLVRQARYAVKTYPPAVRVFLDGLGRSLLNVRPDPLFGFRLPPGSHPAKPSRPTAVSQPLSWAFTPFST